MTYLQGQTVRFTLRTYSDPAATVPADPTAVAVTVHSPDGTSATYTWAAAQVVRESVGVFHLDILAAQAGHYEVFGEATGAVTTSRNDSFDVRAPYTDVVSVQDVRARLNKTLTVDDDEIRDMIDAAIAEYEQWVGPVSGTRTDVLDGGGTSLLLSTANPATLVSLAYADGTVIDTADVTLDTTTGLVFWNYGTAGRFSGGSRFVTVQYTVGPVPANHREAIIADVAGYFEATQAGPVGPDEGYGFGSRTTPLVLFPRIRALAVPSIA